MERERASVGLDVHARSVVACGIDDETGELFRARLVPDPEVIFGWLRRLPGPVGVVYRAGPTGYGLTRFLPDRHFRCVAAPSERQRPSEDRVKTDVKEALLLARLPPRGRGDGSNAGAQRRPRPGPGPGGRPG